MNTLPYPTQPEGSLYGSFPAFPTESIGYHYNILGYNLGFSVSIPDVVEIPLWIFEIVEYALGYAGAYFEYILQYITAWIGNTIIYVFASLLGIFDSILGTIEQITAKAGIWAIPFDMIIIGLMLVALVMLGFAIIKGITKLTGGI